MKCLIRKTILMGLTLTVMLAATSCNKQSDKNAQQEGKEPTASNHLAKEENKTTINKEEKKMNKPVEMTAAMFREKIMDYQTNPNEWKYQGDKPAVIDFYATWCGPCKATAPVLEELAGEYTGQIDFYKVDVDQQEELAALFGVRSIPTLVFIPKEGQPQTAVGAMNKQQLQEAIQATILKH